MLTIKHISYMKHLTIFYLTSLLFLAAACSDEESDPFGGWESGIELSAESVTLSNDAPSQTVYVGEGQGGWYITAVTTDDNKTVLEQQEQEALRGGADFERAFDWLTVKVEGNAIGLTAAENAGWDRTFVIDLAAYGCVARITGGQLAHSDGTPLTATPQDVRLSFRGGSATVETRKDNWWVASVLLGETPYEPYDGADKGIGERPKERTLDKTFGWLGVKAEGTQLVLSAEKNRLDQNQTFAITLTDGTQECTVTGQQYCIYNELKDNGAN